MVIKKYAIENGRRKEDAAPKLDALQSIMGAFGKYQLLLFLLVILTRFPVAFHQMAIIFLAPVTPYTCKDANSTSLCPCTEPEYNRSIFPETIISRWNLICEDKWLTSFTQTIFQLGTLLGSILFGMASDRFGRKCPVVAGVVLQIGMSIGAAFAPDYWTFTFIRFFVGMSVGGTIVTGYVLVMEFIGTQYRDVCTTFYQVPFNMGHLLLPLFAYFFRHYADFQLAISLPSIVLLSYFFLIPETPRWLIAVKRTDDAVKVLERVATVNNRPTANIREDVETYQRTMAESNLKKGTLLDLARSPNLRRNLIAMSINWLACSYCFYGVSQYVGQLSGNAFINVAISASVTLLGTLMSIPLMRVIGRKTIIIICNFVCTICLLILAFIPEGVGSVVCASIGVVSSFTIFVIVYVYCIELFPTVVRSAAIGFSSMMARVGSMIAPFIIELRDVALWMPPVAFAVLPLIAGCVAFLMPETKGCDLMTTIEEGEQFGRNNREKSNKSND